MESSVKTKVALTCFFTAVVTFYCVQSGLKLKHKKVSVGTNRRSLGDKVDGLAFELVEHYLMLFLLSDPLPIGDPLSRIPGREGGPHKSC